MAESVFFRLKNFMIVEEAEVEVGGITLVRGQNDSGKSTFMQGLYAATRNAAEESQIRYGTSSFQVDMAIPIPGSSPTEYRTLSFVKKQETPPVVTIDGDTKEKLGRKPIDEIDPTFPFRVVRYEKETFLPNFVFQKEVPVFDQLDVYSFFASMFEPIAQLSRHLLTVKKRYTEADTNATSAEAQVLSMSQLLADFGKRLSEMDVTTIEANYAGLQEFDRINKDLAALRAEVGQLAQQEQALLKYETLRTADLSGLQAAYSSADSLLRIAQGIEAKKQEIAKLRVDMARTRLESIKALQDYLALGVRMGEALAAHQRELEQVQKMKQLLPSLATLRAQVVLAEDLLAVHRKASTIPLAQHQQHLQNLHNLQTLVPHLQAYKTLMAKSAAVNALRNELVPVSKDVQQLRASLITVTDCPVCGTHLDKPLTEHLKGAHHA